MKRTMLTAAGLAVAMMATSAVSADIAQANTKAMLDGFQKAYISEINAAAMYDAYAAKADAEGFKDVGSLFRAASMTETINSVKHIASMKELGANLLVGAGVPVVKSTRDNLKAAIKLEKKTQANTYKDLQKLTDASTSKTILYSISGASGSGESLVKIMEQALDNMDGWKAGTTAVLVCKICAYVTTDSAIQLCPVCTAPRSEFDSFQATPVPAPAPAAVATSPSAPEAPAPVAPAPAPAAPVPPPEK